MVDSAVNSSNVSAYVGADNYGAGQMAAKSALKNVEGPLHVGLVNYNVNSPNAQEREEGVIRHSYRQRRAEVPPPSTAWPPGKCPRRDADHAGPPP